MRLKCEYSPLLYLSLGEDGCARGMHGKEAEEEAEEGGRRREAEIDVKEAVDGRETLKPLVCRLRDWITSTK